LTAVFKLVKQRDKIALRILYWGIKVKELFETVNKQAKKREKISNP